MTLYKVGGVGNIHDKIISFISYQIERAEKKHISYATAGDPPMAAAEAEEDKRLVLSLCEHMPTTVWGYVSLHKISKLENIARMTRSVRIST